VIVHSAVAVTASGRSTTYLQIVFNRYLAETRRADDLDARSAAPEDWRLFFEERAAVAEFDGGLPRKNAEAQAFECCVVKWLDLNPTPSAPGHCAWCGQSERHDAVVPYGTEPGTHIWLHAQCWPEWQKMRRSHAKEALTRMGIGDLPDGCIVSGCCSHLSNEHQQQLEATRSLEGM
jgi:hypothetical protein